MAEWSERTTRPGCMVNTHYGGPFSAAGGGREKPMRQAGLGARSSLGFLSAAAPGLGRRGTLSPGAAPPQA